MNLTKIALARAKVMNNEMDVDLESLYRYQSENEVKTLEGWMSRYIGEILLNIDEKHVSEAEGWISADVGEILLNIDEKHMSEAEDWIKKAIEADSKNGMMFMLGKDYALYAELYKRKGDTPKAKENLSKATAIFKECGADGWVTRTQEALAAI